MSLHMEMTTAKIHDTERRLANLLNRTYLQVMSPTISLKWTTQRFHRPSVTSTYDSAESIATLPLESVLDDEQMRNMLASQLYIQEREKQVQTDHKFITPSEKTLYQVETCSCVHTQEESRVKNRTSTETVFPWHIEQFKERMNHYPDSLSRKMTRDSCLTSKEITYSQR